MTPFDMAQRFVGEIKELPGAQQNNPFIQWCLSLCGFGPSSPDETAWCSAFVNGVCWLLRLPRSKSAAARSWLTVGQSIALQDACQGYDVVILKRDTDQGPEVLNAPGHVGFFAGLEGDKVLLLAGNQGNAVSVLAFPIERVLGVRRLSAA